MLAFVTATMLSGSTAAIVPSPGARAAVDMRATESATRSGAASQNASVPVSGALHCPPGSIPSGVGCIDAKPVHITCTARKGLKFYTSRLNYWRDKMGAGRAGFTPAGHLPGCPRYLAHVLQRKAHAARVAYEKWAAAKRVRFRQLYEKWRCIHEHEGAWNANTGNGYYGGLQMTLWFQKTYGSEFYGRWGTANFWPVWAQLEAAERAYQSDGDYGQWGTAPTCGLPT